ncbi:hypothetical protein [Streptomyces sp. NPDC048002]|uniref:hypothetical protein n=1 Tax=Streptomyces sp. NPDC048002 TaxID=3154344 RepID=UPI0033C0D9A2
MPSLESAARFAEEQVGPALDSPQARLAVMRRLYTGPHGRERLRLPYRRAGTAFMNWQIRRGLLRPPDGPSPGSPWWRAVNERLLHDGWEALGLCVGLPGTPSAPSVAAAVEFIRAPSPRAWYRAHNAGVVAAYLEHRELAAAESRTERFFMNVVLLRVLYAHALVAAPRLALGGLGPAAPLLGDPRLGMTGIFLSISRILPDRYPLGDDVESYVAREHGFGRLLDHGVITPRLRPLYAWSARALAEPRLPELLDDGIPVYNWPARDRAPWRPEPSALVRAVRRGLPARA